MFLNDNNQSKSIFSKFLKQDKKCGIYIFCPTRFCKSTILFCLFKSTYCVHL